MEGASFVSWFMYRVICPVLGHDALILSAWEELDEDEIALRGISDEYKYWRTMQVCSRHPSEVIDVYWTESQYQAWQDRMHYFDYY